MKRENRSVLATVPVGLLLSALAISRLTAQAPSDANKSLPRYPFRSTALLVVDPDNDFLSEGGKAWRRYRPGDWEGARFLPYRQTLQGIQRGQLFAFGSWGAEFRTEFAPKPGEVVASEHWISHELLSTDEFVAALAGSKAK